MRIIKYSTKNLVCYEQKDSKGQTFWGVYEQKRENEKPICIYVNRKMMHLNTIIDPIQEYEYLEELKDIIQFLYNSGVGE